MKYTLRMWTEAKTVRADDGSHLLNIEARNDARALELAIDYLIAAWFWTPSEIAEMRYNVIRVEEVPKCVQSAGT